MNRGGAIEASITVYGNFIGVSWRDEVKREVCETSDRARKTKKLIADS